MLKLFSFFWLWLELQRINTVVLNWLGGNLLEMHISVSFSLLYNNKIVQAKFAFKNATLCDCTRLGNTTNTQFCRLLLIFSYWKINSYFIINIKKGNNYNNFMWWLKKRLKKKTFILSFSAHLWWRDHVWKQRRMPLPSVIFITALCYLCEANNTMIGFLDLGLLNHWAVPGSHSGSKNLTKADLNKTQLWRKFTRRVMLLNLAMQCAWTNIWSQDIHCRKSQATW